jgi:hypothetical protein
MEVVEIMTPLAANAILFLNQGYFNGMKGVSLLAHRHPN